MQPVVLNLFTMNHQIMFSVVWTLQVFDCNLIIVTEFYTVHTSLTLPRVSFLLLLRFGFEHTVGAKPLSDLKKWCSCSVLHLINGIT